MEDGHSFNTDTLHQSETFGLWKHMVSYFDQNTQKDLFMFLYIDKQAFLFWIALCFY